MDFYAKLQAIWKRNNSLLCIGLDPEPEKLPEPVRSAADPLFEFNKQIIEATKDVVCCFKPNTAFYEAAGADGIRQLKATMDYLHDACPDVPVIIDAKRGDVANTSNGSAAFVFDYLGADAVTISPYLGKEANEPYLKRAGKGIFVLCRTSNEGAVEFQDLTVDGRPLYQHVAAHVADEWNQQKNCHLVVGATYPEETKAIREIVGPDMVFLMPGLGAQGGDTEHAVKNAVNADGTGVIFNSSRSILYASPEQDFAEKARDRANEMNNDINTHRKAS